MTAMDPSVVTIEATPAGHLVAHLHDGTTRPATDEEIASMEWRLPALEVGEERPLPRHRPPTFKDPGKTVAPRLPGNVFGAPRAVR